MSEALSRRNMLVATGAVASVGWSRPLWAAIKASIAPQPFFASVKRAIAAMSAVGGPIRPEDVAKLDALSEKGDTSAVEAASGLLQKYSLATVTLDVGGLTQVVPGGAPKALVEQGWTAFLVRVENPKGVTKELKVTGSDNSVSTPSTGAARAGVADTLAMGPSVAKTWYRNELYRLPPIGGTLTGEPVEYQILQIYSRDRGSRAMALNFYAGADSDFTSSDPFTAGRLIDQYSAENFKFDCAPSSDIPIHIRDDDGRGCMASLILKDKFDRVYPYQAMRLAPDMYFHAQIYRADGETVRLPDGEYSVESRRGPEYLVGCQTLRVKDGAGEIHVQLKRWIDPAKWGWYSGDTHIHGGGCAHYEHPTEGVSPETMIRHVRGEGLAIGDVLSWGPSWYYQKRFFSGAAVSPAAVLEHPDLQSADNASLVPVATAEDVESSLRYDVEVSGFPSSFNGHLVLLHLKEQDYPGTTLIQDWPSWNLPILKWAKAQGGLVGYAHCGLGMTVKSTELPNYDIPPMDSIGTQEAIMDVTHGFTDFISGVNTIPVAELNAWYHMLNCGFRLALIGETDYPCISGERPGMGRSYVRLAERPVGNNGYEAWIQGVAAGRLYCGDGRSHFLDWTVNGVPAGGKDVKLSRAGTLAIKALVAARLDEKPHQDDVVPHATPDGFALLGWEIERARIGSSRNVAVELIVNGQPMERQVILADGTPRELTFSTKVDQSSWVALRILPSAHTHPIFVQVGDKPIRASRKSAEWCRKCVDKLWDVKSPQIRESERVAAAEAYDHARRAYDRIISESSQS